jgi:AcrR family transcriptional regulator
MSSTESKRPRRPRRARPAAGARRPRNQPAAETRARLIDAALRLLSERGVAGVSVRDVAALAGVNHGLVHRYFGSKEALVRAAVERVSALVYPADAPPRAAWFFERLVAHPEIAVVVARACLDGPHDLLAAAAPPPALFDALLARLAPMTARLPPVGGRPLDPRVVNALWTAAMLGWHVFAPMLRAGYRLPDDADDQLRALVTAFDAMLGPA